MTQIIVDPSTSIPRHKFRSSPEAETRLLLLIDGFSRKRGGESRSLEGRVKLAKLDFLLRYPGHLSRVLQSIGVTIPDSELLNLLEAPLDARMMRYRYGPWDPSYYAVLGSLIGRGLVGVEPLPRTSGLGYSTTPMGGSLASELSKDESFAVINTRVKVLRRYLDKSGSTLKEYLYKLPEVADSTWHEEIG
ncbi:hypothetical protein GTZ78_24370 [Streptomyces sp. SID8361]|uniref:hypothetical protein n=1 Tax=Streptomyces sp. MnatMP-M27 TaxID=1839768 RepID=UPI00114CCD7A|nr:hypothetical protein [Streptomyces sp. MnatMP-M27]MYU13737.1 hypothetical protein [Streptomyces sp. SID8361]